MTSSVVSTSCRLTIVSATQRVDLAVPVQTTIAELLSLIVSGLGSELADQGAAEGGWVLQRLGEAPLDQSTTVAASQLVDGDLLHLRTRATRLPEMAYDDVLEAVADGVLNRTARWGAPSTAAACSVFAGAFMIFALIAIVLAGSPWLTGSITAGLAAVLLGLAAAALGRIEPARRAAVTAGGFAVAFGVVCGATAVGSSHSVWEFGAPQLLVGAGAAVLTAAVMLIVVPGGDAGFASVVTLALLTAIGSGISTASTLSAAGTAGIIAILALVISPIMPTLSFRLARISLPPIPLDAADLRRDSDTIDARQILGQAVRSDRYLTGLVGGTSLAIAGAAAVLSAEGTSQRILAIVLGFVCLLRGRLFTGRAQRALLLFSGGASLLAVATGGVIDAHGRLDVFAFILPSVVVAIALIAMSSVLPGRRYAPTAGRAADIFETLLVLSVIPLTLMVMGVFGQLRHLHS